MPSVRLHPEAETEYEDAYTWYGEISRNLAVDFIMEVDYGLTMIKQFPEAWSKHLRGTRRYHLKRFPYWIIYRYESEEFRVYAVAHDKRRPGYRLERSFENS